MLHGCQDDVRWLGPDEGSWVGVGFVEVVLDAVDQFLDAAMDTALDLSLGKESKPTFNQIQPG